MCATCGCRSKDKKQDAKEMKGMNPKQKAAFKKADKKMDKKAESKDKKDDKALAKKIKKKK